jgi:hypothetical protein
MNGRDTRKKEQKSSRNYIMLAKAEDTSAFFCPPSSFFHLDTVTRRGFCQDDN